MAEPDPWHLVPIVDDGLSQVFQYRLRCVCALDNPTAIAPGDTEMEADQVHMKGLPRLVELHILLTQERGCVELTPASVDHG